MGMAHLKSCMSSANSFKDGLTQNSTKQQDTTKPALKNSKDKKAWRRWFELNYTAMVDGANKFVADPHDLVHHCFLRVDKAPMHKVMDNPSAYFRKVMWIEGTRGRYKKAYTYRNTPDGPDPVYDPDLSEAIMREEFELVKDRLTWFDRQVLDLYIEGYNLSEVARESGIDKDVFHTSLYRSRKKLKDVLR